MKISYSSYQLQPLHALNAQTSALPRSGALLRYELASGWVGYADLHPWPELGDPALPEQLMSLRTGQPQLLAQRAQALAEQFTQLLETPVANLKNNYLVSDLRQIDETFIAQLESQKLTSIKLKMGLDEALELQKLKLFKDSSLKIRLDYNSRGSLVSLQKLLLELGDSLVQKIEYIEDPTPYEPRLWQELNQSVPLALDHEYKNFLTQPHKDQHTFSVLIIKPAWQDPLELLKLCEERQLLATVTSSMGHPLSDLMALATAAQLKNKFPHRMLTPGCSTQHLYQPVPGWSRGAEDYLRGLSWQSL